MADPKKAVEYKEVENPSIIDQAKRVISYVYDKVRLIRYEVVAEAPANDEEAQALYGCPLATLVKMGVRQAIYGCNFATIIESSQKENWDEQKTLGELQTVVSGIDLKPKEKVERAKATAEVKAKAKELDSLLTMAKAAGFETVAEFIASLQAKKSKK